MSTFPTWQYDEFKQIGTDYGSAAEVARYDERMSRLRNITEECAAIVKLLDIKPESRVLEIGAGTGEFAIAVAQRCAQVCAADVSQVMIDYAQQKAIDRGINNIAFARAGFLTYNGGGEPFDAVVSQLALHHLPDFWKTVALRRVWHMLKDGGHLFLRDVVFSFDIDNAAESVDGWIRGVTELGGDEVGREVASHVRDEFSTFGCVLEKLLQLSGFSIMSSTYQKNHMFADYVCQKS